MNTVKYLSAQEISDLWGITKRRVQNLCVNNRIPGAVRIGNMWAIPSDATKPIDARIRKHISIKYSNGTLIRKARKELKAFVDTSLSKLEIMGVSPVEALHFLVVIFSAKLLKTYINDFAICINTCEDFFDCKISIPIPVSINQRIDDYISEYRTCLDDSLSWVYQFGSKKSNEFQYKDTQFFTEKYMIRTLVDSLKLDSNVKIIDPACGGGNFLLYSFETLAANIAKSNSVMNQAIHILNCLYGYEIDQFLAFVASFNLKIKVLDMINKEQNVTIEIFNSLHTKVFYPKHEFTAGFLDIDWDKQIVINCDSNEQSQLKKVFKGSSVVVTNPPFRTIKGMPIEQKDYLQKHYPLAKCDMCNAFIERVMSVLPENGKAAMVTQNSWMYLDSFTSMRKKLLKKYTINNIWELGSNAFYDLSGEKANVVLVTFLKKQPNKEHSISQHFLRNFNIEQIERTLENNTLSPLLTKQIDILNNIESRFDMISTEHLRSLQANCEQYRDYAVPMQGTSTGDAKNLVDYYWNHIGDTEWILVSKGGGYSRFEGLNSYCVRWGKDGEYIKNTKGSAIRNANYFNQTDLVFSDTGTAGLNVRLLMPGQIFIASGPGIRVVKGRRLAHLAFLNSRFAAFFVRLISPKLTIAAGYIGQIPVKEELLNSYYLESIAKQCLTLKAHRLMKRPNNIEFTYINHTKDKRLSEMAKLWFEEDLNDEWNQLLNEQKIEDTIVKEMNLSVEDCNAIDNYIGGRNILSTGLKEKNVSMDESDLIGILGDNCCLRRTKANKKSLGADGLIEFISQLKGVSCEKAYSTILEKYKLFEENYINLYMHALLLSSLKFREKATKEITDDKLLQALDISSDIDFIFAKKWIRKHFNHVHNSVFEENPIFKYDPINNMFLLIKE